MHSASGLLAFAGVAVVVIVTPGPDTVLTIRNTILGGRWTGLATAAGIAIGQTIWTVVTSAGLATLLLASAAAFLAVKLAGAAYLVYMGAHTIWDALRRDRTREGSPPHLTGCRATGWTGLRQGIISDLGNPKMAVFFVSMLPQFVPADRATFNGLVPLGLLFALMTLTWLAGYAVLAARIGDAMRRPRIRRVVDTAVGAVLVALGVRIAAESR